MISFYFEKIRFEKIITTFSDFIVHFFKKNYSFKFIIQRIKYQKE